MESIQTLFIYFALIDYNSCVTYMNDITQRVSWTTGPRDIYDPQGPSFWIASHHLNYANNSHFFW